MACSVQMLSSSKKHEINGFNQFHKDFLEASVACLVKDVLITSPPLRLSNRTHFIIRYLILLMTRL
jgi:hypothetical protein